MPFNSLQGPMPTEQAMQEVLAEIQGGNFETIDEINEFLNNKLLTQLQRKHRKRIRNVLSNWFTIRWK
ncbi:hypothetical protein QNH48_26030 [Neobacillus sp. YX16]|uniref:hypothetical protein n=1 Tax=Neobacillus sp. YX16 TaxID=3047874 RepID=UPI0024C38BCE|nr:hypothetical protein [Neobacillus sp. YX16]WHZ02362.1 hypothetical protein QNH48_26030 [Neobacillus sp. YX16]